MLHSIPANHCPQEIWVQILGIVCSSRQRFRRKCLPDRSGTGLNQLYSCTSLLHDAIICSQYNDEAFNNNHAFKMSKRSTLTTVALASIHACEASIAPAGLERDTCSAGAAFSWTQLARCGSGCSVFACRTSTTFPRPFAFFESPTCTSRSKSCEWIREKLIDRGVQTAETWARHAGLVVP